MEKFQPQDFAQFFLLTHLDEMKAVDYATEAMAVFRRLQKTSDLSRKTDQNFVKATYRIWKKYPLRVSIKHPLPPLAPEFIERIPADQLKNWCLFLTQIRSDEILVLLWHELFGVSVNDLGSAFEISVGTVRYRLQKSFIRIGHYLRNNGGK